LKFYENIKPPYFGPWTKKSDKIRPRNCLKKDDALLNYEVDSDDEWEEEEPGDRFSFSFFFSFSSNNFYLHYLFP